MPPAAKCIDTDDFVKDDFTPCESGIDTDDSYDICVSGECVTPGCGDESCNVPGPSFFLPDTNQRKCYDETGEMTCPSSDEEYYGQDAQYNYDSDSDQRFNKDTSTGESVVTDKVTGLIWQECAAGLTGSECDSDSDSGDAIITQWKDAVIYCANLEWGKYTDWRLPDKFALESIVDIGSYDPAINVKAFPDIDTDTDTPSEVFWSSCSYAVDTSYAWSIDFSSGIVSKSQKTSEHYIRCVRGGSEQPGKPGNDKRFTNQRFTRNTNTADEPVVTDYWTELMWQGCRANIAGNDCDKNSADDDFDWKSALAYCEDLAWGDHYDWRLPNRRELISLLDNHTIDIEEPPINTDVFPNAIKGDFWTSSSCAQSGENAWSVSFNNGQVNIHVKNSHGPLVRCVRNIP